MLHISPITPFPRKAIAAGIFEGRFARQLSFSRKVRFGGRDYGKRAGGLDANFRLAGDFDLWRRFAKQSDLVIVDTILGCFRIRAGQLSANMARYHAEIDASLSVDEMKIRAKTAKSYAKAGFKYRVVVRHYVGPWQCECWPMCIAPIFGTRAFNAEHLRLSVLEWFAEKHPVEGTTSAPDKLESSH